MSTFYLESEEMPEEERRALEEALSPLAESDCTLLVEISYVGEEEIRELNRSFRSVDRVTDVLSFPALDGIRGQVLHAADHPLEQDEEGRLFLGSIAICTQRAREQAQEYGHSYERELNYLAVHGVLHCLGYDHETQEERAQMREKEEGVMQTLHLTRE